MSSHRARYGTHSESRRANLITVICGLGFGAIISFLLFYLLASKFNLGISLKLYVMLIEVGAGLSLYFGQKTLRAGEEGVLSLVDNYLNVKAKPGLYWTLPGILNIQSVPAKLTTVQVVIKNPLLKGGTSLTSASATITVIVDNVLAAARTADPLAVAKGLCESGLRAYLSGRDVLQVETSQIDLIESLDEVSLGKLTREAAEAGQRVVSIYLDALEIPTALLDAKNQFEIEKAERRAQEQERAWREEIINKALAKNATYAEAQAEADRLTGKRITVTTTQITPGKDGGSSPTVVLDSRGDQT